MLLNGTNGALNYLRERQAQLLQEKTQKEKEKTIREFRPNQNGYYTMQQCYIINNMICNGAVVESNGNITYKGKDYKIIDVTAYNITTDYYEQLRQLGLKNIVELLTWYDNTIELIRKINNEYYYTTITDNSIIDKPYSKQYNLLTFSKVGGSDNGK